MSVQTTVYYKQYRYATPAIGTRLAYSFVTFATSGEKG
jgi:hypothetical protein